MDINELLAGEQRSLLHARFTASPARGRHVSMASLFAARLKASSYPYRGVKSVPCS